MQGIEITSRATKIRTKKKKLFANDNFSAEGQEVEERGANLVLHADAAVRIRGTQDIADVESDAIIRKTHEKGHGGAVEIGVVVAIFLTDAKEAGRGSVFRSSAGANGKIHGETVGYNEKSALR